MVLIKERVSQDSLSVASATMIRRASTSISVVSASSLNLSSLTLGDTHQSGSQLSTYCSQGNHQQAGMKRGWGSIETRRASTSLNTMAGPTQEHLGDKRSRPTAEDSNGKDGWGYFVDTAQDDDEDVLMW